MRSRSTATGHTDGYRWKFHHQNWERPTRYLFRLRGKLDIVSFIGPEKPRQSFYSQDSRLTASDAALGSRFGNVVSLRGAALLVGAPFDDDAGSLSGAAYLLDPPAAVPALHAKAIGLLASVLVGIAVARIASSGSQL